MAVVSFSLKDLGIENAAELAEKMGLDVEGIEGGTLSLDVPPNRPDLLDFFGLKRGMLYYSGKKIPSSSDYTVNGSPETSITVSKKVEKIRPFISSFVAKNVSMDEQHLKYLINFTEKLSETYGRKRRKMAMGLHNYDAVKGPLRYDAASNGEFIPLGSEKPMSFGEIIKLHPKGIAFGGTIPGAASGETMFPYLRDGEKIMSLIPIINSKATAISKDTKNILVDVTGTSERTVRSTASLLAASFIEQGAAICPVEIKYEKKSVVEPEMPYREIKVNLAKIDGTLGMRLMESLLITYANRLGYPASKYGNSLLVKVPPYRLDVFNYQDVIEDIAIGFGYENINPMPVRSTAVGLLNELQEYINKLSIFMIGLGYSEAINNYLTSEEVSFGQMEIPEDKDVVKVTYSKTENITMLRKAVLPSLLLALGRSTHERMPQKLFEVGSVFSVESGKAVERINLAFASEHSKSNFADAQGALNAILGFLGMKYSLKEESNPSFIEGRCAGVFVEGRRVGMLGELHPKVLTNFKIAEPVAACEINLVGEVSYFKE
ncbi:MAG: phenylalanine--tRNA ligase subunit beta [Candidatus Micrarchaeia archaeon]